MNVVSLVVAILAVVIAVPSAAILVWERFIAGADVWADSTWLDDGGTISLLVVVVNTGHRQGIVLSVELQSRRHRDVQRWAPRSVHAQMPLVLSADAAAPTLTFQLVPGLGGTGAEKVASDIGARRDPEVEIVLTYVRRVSRTRRNKATDRPVGVDLDGAWVPGAVVRRARQAPGCATAFGLAAFPVELVPSACEVGLDGLPCARA